MHINQHHDLTGKMEMEEPMQHILNKIMNGQFDEDTIYENSDWTEKDMLQWTNDDVLNWIFCTINSQENNLQNNFEMLLNADNCTSLKAENFQGLTGAGLANLSQFEFVEKDEINGHLLYTSLQKYKNKVDNLVDDYLLDSSPWNLEELNAFYPIDMSCSTKQSGLPGISSFQKLNSFSPTYYTQVNQPQNFSTINHFPPPSTSNSPTYEILKNVSDDIFDANGCWDDYIFDFTVSTAHGVNPSSFDVEELLDFSLGQQPTYLAQYASTRCNHNLTTTSNCRCHSSKKIKKSSCLKLQKRKTGKNPRVKTHLTKDFDDLNSCENLKFVQNTELKEPGHTTAKKTRSTQLWKFMKNLLNDPQYNPECVCWVDERLGVFRIVSGQSKLVASLWGLKKNNPTMNFDKLSRSLRWCRENGFLSPVPKNSGFPKKLCFRFGEKALL